MPENLFFREPSTQNILLDILFVFCKLNGDVGYRQGMHELLAPVFWVVSSDAVDLSLETGAEDRDAVDDDLLRSTMNSKYIEHDAFTIFCIIMQTAKSFYEMASNPQSAATRASDNSPIVERSKRIHDVYLRRVDLELTEHLTTIDILPQIFVIRWIRLLFGREFPFDDVLSVWDTLFAEDPALNLMDLVCVAMLLRVRWQLLEADYSSALTLLLRYPVPTAPHGPTTLVEDALYLKKHLNSEGGVHLITKYTGRSPVQGSKARTGSSRRALHTPQGSHDRGRPVSPLRSPSQLLTDSSGIEAILQEAAKGAFKQGEKLGSSLRGALQGFQQGNNSPRRALENIRSTLNEGRLVVSSNENLSAKINALEDRNKELAKMLQDAMDDLSAQARIFEERKAEDDANALTLSIAKLHFVHVYLENSTLPLHPEAEENTQVLQQDEQPAHPTLGSDKAVIAESSQGLRARERSGSDQTTESPTRSKPVRRRPPTALATAAPEEKVGTQQSLFQRPRPALAESSFSWMLGDDRSKSNFVSASPLAPEQIRKPTAIRSKAGFLFGDKDDDKAAKDKPNEEQEDDEGFTMGTLKAAREG
jgi:TBC1 domain family protein 5